VKWKVIYIRCSPQTFYSWREWAARFDSYEEALRFLLEKARELGLKPHAYL